MKYGYEIILPNEDLPFKMFIFEGKDGNYIREKHWHPSIEIFAIFEGSLRFFLNDIEYCLESGDFVLVNSNEVHSIFARKSNTTVVLQIPLNIFENYYLDEPFIMFSHEPSVQDKRVMELIWEMYRIYTAQECGYELLVQSIFYKFLYLLVTEYRIAEVSPEFARGYRKLNRLSEITSYIEENYQSDLSLEKLAAVFGYSPAYLSKMFPKYATITYRDYLQSIRVERAKRELTRTDHMISDIAVKHGFSDSKAFSKAFRKKYGVLPSEYRKDLRI